ncbi:AAA+ ATPase domain,P-loop containing nucleoside triphosphate hydrolase,ABC transporter-like,ABC-2 type [Cinara cedri]|uniref:AAA+ ATPase domain,P-loop containing nucleoside triphosphate hydrolase,ABC transporter-like,ABC-2 type n=1 Tax=Cinara cedri TaxID=506608 RepID=A0A5E4N8H6_9HEMI|nr:AAA+ ATPase domain,P-loop containing nucleoside triphosphate hydrolase,ABC transporter-like,ABC-2 type [Cinara cedri]
MDLAATYSAHFFNADAPADVPKSAFQLCTHNGGQYDESCLPIYWENLNVHALVKNDRWFRSSVMARKLLLNNVDGYIPPCSLVAIMGPSGAGKSTLMAALANKLPAHIELEGSVKIGSISVKNFKSYNFGYMYQHDLFCGVLTVKEHLYFMAKLKLDRRISEKNQKARVLAIIDELGLSQCANTKIGFGRENGKITLSGGERKIVSFATELLTDPPFLFCDEPTTGLDSYSAKNVVSVMQRLVSDQGKTVVCIIHQPSSELLNVFQQLILVADGRIAYSGPPVRVTSFFESCVGFRCPENYNCADFIMKILSDGNKSVNSICDEFAASKQAEVIKNAISNEIYFETSSISVLHNHLSPFWPVKLYHLTGRYLLEKVRDPTIDVHRFLQKVGIAVMVGLCYLGTVQRTQNGIQSFQGVFFMLITENFFTPMYSVMNQLPVQLPLFRREYTSGLYGASTFYAANLLSFIPTLIIEPTVYTTIIYCMAGLKNDLYAYFLTVIITILVMAVSTSCGIMFNNIFGSLSLALTFVQPFDNVIMILSGIFVNIRSIPWYLHWIVFISWFELGFEALTILHWKDVDYIACSQDPDVPCLMDGSDVLDKYEFTVSNLMPHIYLMVWLFVGFHVISFACFVTRARLNKLS